MAEPNTTTSASTSLVLERQLEEALAGKFPFLQGHITIQRARRVWASVPMAELVTVLVYAKEVQKYDMLCAITGTDEGTGIGLLYHLANPNGIVLTLMTMAPKDGPGPSTVTPYFPLAELYEREVIDLLGARILGLPEGNRYPLPDAWPEGQYPLRKDWQPGTAPSRSQRPLNESDSKERFR
ncbi:MAG: NADH-quinone oxidoreductase subunit C [Polyangiaceae bacterium]